MKQLLAVLLMAMVMPGCEKSAEPISPQLHAFYYPWYGTPEHDGKFLHWRHDVMGETPRVTFPGGEEIGADFYPEGGCYSSGDPEVIERHMRQLRKAHIGVICVSWFGEDSVEAQALPILMDTAAEHGIMVNFHLEPTVQESIETIAHAIKYLTEKFGDHPAFYRGQETGGRGLFYVYDSYNTPASQWARLLKPDGALTIRGTPWDAAVVGLILHESDTGFIEASGMDGGYAYFAVDGFSYASTTANWPQLVAWAHTKDLLFIPSVGPGYADLRIRPWNSENQRSRNSGQYYDCMFARAIAANPSIIGITSFNEWHEGTQIEPAMAFASGVFTYENYQPLEPDAYLLKTAYWETQWSQLRSGNKMAGQLAESLCGGGISRTRVHHLAVERNLHLNTEPSINYTAGGRGALVDGIAASNNYRDGCWQGFESVDLVATIDLGESLSASEVTVSFLVNHAVWVFGPHNIQVEGSTDGANYRLLGSIIPGGHSNTATAYRHEETIAFPGQSLRHLRVVIESTKSCPANHPGAGQAAWLFLDEIQVK